jgi:UDP-GlcNAc:undecaprenyl-phosphate GlcNAc-1-phosphate transferase
MWFGAYLIVLVVAMAVSAALVPVCRRLARRSGLIAAPHPDKQDIEPTPLMGGVAIFAAFAITVVGAYVVVLLARGGAFASLVPETVREYAPGMLRQAPRLVVVLLGALCMVVLGLFDDKRGLSPFVKLAVQAVVAVALVLFGVRLSLFIQNDLLAGIITVLWILIVINALNFLDNMDGLAAGVAAIAAFFFLLTAVQYDQYFVAAMLAAFTGAVVGFLFYNVHPASIFMGDAGSMFLGYMLAVLTVLGTYYVPDASKTDQTTFPVIVPLVVLAIPLYEMVTVTTIRLRKGLSPFKASKHHFSFRMRGLGLGVRGAVGFICLAPFKASKHHFSFRMRGLGLGVRGAKRPRTTRTSVGTSAVIRTSAVVRTFAVRTLGCKVNQYETQRLVEQLEALGWRESVNGDAADLCIVNTCTVTETADAKSRQALRRFRRRHPDAVVVAAGCYSERDRAALEAIEGVDYVLDNAEKERLVEVLDLLPAAQTPLPSGISRFAGHARGPEWLSRARPDRRAPWRLCRRRERAAGTGPGARRHRGPAACAAELDRSDGSDA